MTGSTGAGRGAAAIGNGERQRGRIARLLGVEVGEVTGLDSVPAEDLQILHDQISQALYGDAQEAFAKLAGLASRIPTPICGKLAERFMPPMIAARVAEVMEPARTRDLVARLSTPYIAAVAVALDPVRCRPVVGALPAERIGEVAGLLYAEGEYAVMAELADAITEPALARSLEVARPRDILAIVPLLDWTERVDRLVAALPVAQVAAIVAELSTEELAELAVALHPTRFGPVLAELETADVVAIAQVMLARDEHEAAGHFVDVLAPATLEAVVAAASRDDVRALRAHLSSPVAREALDQALART